jgi:hypothetical protein
MRARERAASRQRGHVLVRATGPDARIGVRDRRPRLTAQSPVATEIPRKRT